MNNPFSKATRRKAYLKLALAGPSGSGKTMSALRLARGLTDGPIAFLDTENNSASLYANHSVKDDRNGSAYPLTFDVCPVSPPYMAETFLEIIRGAKDNGYEVLVIDSFSHVWEAVLSFKEKMDSAGGNSYTNWNVAGKKFQGVVDLVRSIDMHIIVCMRSKMEYVLELNEKGKSVPRKVGLAPIVRDGTEYDFSTMFDIGMDHMARDSKGRLSHITGGEPVLLTESLGAKLRDWVNEGEAPLPPPDTWTDEKIGLARAAASLALASGKSQVDIDAIKAKNLPPTQAIAELNALANSKGTP